MSRKCQRYGAAGNDLEIGFTEKLDREINATELKRDLWHSVCDCAHLYWQVLVLPPLAVGFQLSASSICQHRVGKTTEIEQANSVDITPLMRNTGEIRNIASS